MNETDKFLKVMEGEYTPGFDVSPEEYEENERKAKAAEEIAQQKKWEKEGIPDEFKGGGRIDSKGNPQRVH